MKEKLTIKKFGPIKSAELEFGRFNVLIGENATGKSTIAKILAVCRYFSYIVDSYKLHLSNSTIQFIQGLSLHGLSEFLKDDTYIFYECQHYSFLFEKSYHSVRYIDNDIIKDINPILAQSTKLIPISKEFINLLSELEKIKPSNNSDVAWTIPTSFYQNDVAAVLDNPFYLPTERGLQSIFSLGKSSIPNISDSLYNQFSNLDLIAKNFKSETLIEPLDITYKNEDGKGFIKKNSEDFFYSLSNGASGYKSTIPIVLIIKYYNQIRKKKKTFFIEEPELNLFPKAQNELMKFLVDNIINYKNSILITTHSPYILTSLNNMMYAFQVGKMNDEKIENILDRKYWLNPNDVSVYIMLPNGECESIIDKEGLIKAEKIDEVSSILNKAFNAIMDVELNIK